MYLARRGLRSLQELFQPVVAELPCKVRHPEHVLEEHIHRALGGGSRGGSFDQKFSLNQSLVFWLKLTWLLLVSLQLGFRVRKG